MPLRLAGIRIVGREYEAIGDVDEDEKRFAEVLAIDPNQSDCPLTSTATTDPARVVHSSRSR
jgi:hypothetical protein